MAEEPLDPILLQVTIPLPVSMIYDAFVEAGKITGWLADRATVELRVGGAYRLAWDAPERFDSDGRIIAFHREVDLDFTWQFPPAFRALEGDRAEPSHVYVRLQESPEGIDVTLEHAGWASGPRWEDARSWHFHFWDERLRRLKEYLIAEAYG